MTLIGFRKKKTKKKMTRAVVFSCDLSMNGVVFLTFFFFLFLTHPIGHIVQPPGGERDVKVAREQRTQQHFFPALSKNRA